MRNGATWRGIRWLLAAIGGPCRIKSIKSELSARLSTAASRGWCLKRLTLLVVEARRESLWLEVGLAGVPSFGTRYGLLSSAGPVDLINSAKSDVESGGTRASLARDPFRPVDTAKPGGARGMGPDGLLLVLFSTTLGLAGAGGRRGDGKIPAGEWVTIGDDFGDC